MFWCRKRFGPELRAAHAWRLWSVVLSAALLACGGAESATTGGAAGRSISVVDDAGVTVALPGPAQRVVSLVPSATDVLLALGAESGLVGRTDYDVATALAAIPSVGGGLDPSLETLVSLRPDLVIVWAEAEQPTLRRQLGEVGVEVFAARTQDTTDAFAVIRRLGRLVGADSAAADLNFRLRRDLAAVHASVARRPQPSVVYLVEDDPPMIAGPRTFISQLIEVAGGRPAFPEVTPLWPTISLEALVQRQPDVLVVPQFTADQPLSDLRRLPGWRAVRAVQDGRVIRVPADLLGRPGPRLAEAAELLRDRLHPEVAGGE